jgi:hemolysin III
LITAQPLVRRIIKEPGNGLSHLAGALLAIAGLVVLLALSAGNPWHTVGFAIYGTTLILMFAASALLHSLHCPTHIETRLERLDYAAIFLLIAGTYTPICLTVLRGPWGWSMLGVQWALALYGIVGACRSDSLYSLRRTMIYLAMGWLSLVLIVPLWGVLSSTGLLWLLAGGVAYSIGAVVFVLERPRLWPGQHAAHELWHVLVIGGAACHYAMMFSLF